MTDLRIAVTGHHPKTIGGYSPDNPIIPHIKHALSAHLFSLHPSIVYTGMALGVDQWMAELCVEMGVPFVAAVPFANQASRWPRESWVRWNYLLHMAKSVEILFDTPSSDREAAMLLNRRNEWMVDHADGGARCVEWECRWYCELPEVCVKEGHSGDCDIDPTELLAQPQKR